MMYLRLCSISGRIWEAVHSCSYRMRVVMASVICGSSWLDNREDPLAMGVDVMDVAAVYIWYNAECTS